MSDAAVAEHMRLVRVMSRENEPLSSGGRTATVRNPRWFVSQDEPTPRRRTLHRELVESALARAQPTPDPADVMTSATTSAVPERPSIAGLATQVDTGEGRPRAIVMAGPPGAGKSTVRAQLLGDDAPAWMVIDADAFKDALIDRAIEDGSYEEQIKPDAVRALEAGGERFFPLEMSALLQAESGQLARDQRAQAVAAGRDILIDTVLWNQANAEQIGTQLEAAGYAISVVDVEVPYELSMARVMARWEATYREAMAGRDQRGGRWVPSEYARVVYGGPSGTRGRSLCETTARGLAETSPAVVSYSLFRAQPTPGADVATMLDTPARLEIQMTRERDGAPLVAVTPTGSSGGSLTGSLTGSLGGSREVAGRGPHPVGPAGPDGAVAPPGAVARASSSTSPRPPVTAQSGGSAVLGTPAQREAAQREAAQRVQRRRRRERDIGRDGPGAGLER